VIVADPLPNTNKRAPIYEMPQTEFQLNFRAKIASEFARAAVNKAQEQAVDRSVKKQAQEVIHHRKLKKQSILNGVILVLSLER
jgi:hypothetical protein